MDRRRSVSPTTLDRARRLYEGQLSPSNGTSPFVEGAQVDTPPAAAQPAVSNIDRLAESIAVMGRAFFESQTTMARSLEGSFARLAEANIDSNRRVADLQTSIAELPIRFAALLSQAAPAFPHPSRPHSPHLESLDQTRAPLPRPANLLPSVPPPTPLEPVPAAALSHVDAGAAALPTGHRLDQRSSAPSSNPALVGEWDPEDRETILKSASRPRFVESTGMRIRAFLDDAELFLTLCGRPRSRWGHFVLSWLGHDESEKVRRSHIVENVARYDDFRAGLVTLFGRFEFKGQYREALRSLKQSPGETVAAYAARASDLCSRAYPDFSTETQLDLATEHFISGIVDASSREFLRREFARRQLTWQEAVQLAQASEVNATSSSSSSAAIAGGPHVATADSLARDTCSRAPLYGGGAQSSFQRRGACDAPSTPQVRNAGGAVDTSRRFDNRRENNGSRRHDNPIQPLRSPRFVWDRRARDESNRRPRETAPYQYSRERECRARVLIVTGADTTRRAAGTGASVRTLIAIARRRATLRVALGVTLVPDNTRATRTRIPRTSDPRVVVGKAATTAPTPVTPTSQSALPFLMAQTL